MCELHKGNHGWVLSPVFLIHFGFLAWVFISKLFGLIYLVCMFCIRSGILWAFIYEDFYVYSPTFFLASPDRFIIAAWSGCLHCEISMTSSSSCNFSLVWSCRQLNACITHFPSIAFWPLHVFSDNISWLPCCFVSKLQMFYLLSLRGDCKLSKGKYLI